MGQAGRLVTFKAAMLPGLTLGGSHSSYAWLIKLGPDPFVSKTKSYWNQAATVTFKVAMLHA